MMRFKSFGAMLFACLLISSIHAETLSVDSLKQSIIQMDRKQYEFLGFYPGMPRAEAFAVADKLSSGKIKSMEESQGIFYVQRQPTHLKITVNFPAFTTDTEGDWNASTVPATSIEIETTLPNKQNVVADELKAELVEQYGAANVVDSGDRSGFSPVTMAMSNSAVAQACRKTMQEGGKTSSARDVRAGTSQLREESFTFMQENCPDLIDEFIIYQKRRYGPLLNVHFKPGYPYVTYRMNFNAAERFSTRGKERCEKNPSTC